MQYDYLVVGAGLFGAVFAHEMLQKGRNVLVIDRRDHVAGNAFTKEVAGINVHWYGAHIFHTERRDIWDYMRQFAEFNNYVNAPVAYYRGKVFNLPFNMNTFSKMWPDVITPEQAEARIAEQRLEVRGEPRNLEEKAISLVGRDIYETLIKGYTEKQWGRTCAELPPQIINRLPVRLTYNNNYFRDRYQGIPEGGYTALVEKMLAGVEIRLGIDFLKVKEKYLGLADRVLFTGPIDEYFGFCYGPLEYRSVRFETQILDTSNLQGVAVMNFTDRDVPYTRRIEHKHFEFGSQPKTVVSYEYSYEWKPGDEPYYPVNDTKNAERYNQYAALAENEDRVLFGGRLGTYKYLDMKDAVAGALELVEKELHA